MRIIYQTYIDHQKMVNFPIDFLNKHHKDLIVYTSDKDNAIHLKDYNPIIINKKINIPTDIAEAQNICIEHSLKNFDPDFIVHVQADIFITKYGFDLINQFCTPDNLDKSAHLKIQHIRLAICVLRTYFGATIIGKHSTDRFIGDGAYLNAQRIIGEHTNTAPLYDIGYITLEQFRRHIKRNAITWLNRPGYKLSKEADEMSYEDLANHCINMHKSEMKDLNFKWFDDLLEFDYVIDGIGYRSEYNVTKNVLLQCLKKQNMIV